ncbi:hypothetical protein WN51_05550 [Melipona quadrifasciata]|uniref:Uncharacterized protein n=1 Tax=Melipona quadrifasciata TaxID=166423 RepID=A0A0M8ZRD1_9HYME|nr:hypothetical protein WN51_05550 [Melipona quadrifasciata]
MLAKQGIDTSIPSHLPKSERSAENSFIVGRKKQKHKSKGTELCNTCVCGTNSVTLSRSDARCEYICIHEPPWQGRTGGSVDSLGSAFGIQEAACSGEKAERDWTGRKEQVSRHLETGKGFQPSGEINLVRDEES